METSPSQLPSQEMMIPPPADPLAHAKQTIKLLGALLYAF